MNTRKYSPVHCAYLLIMIENILAVIAQLSRVDIPEGNRGLAANSQTTYRKILIRVRTFLTEAFGEGIGRSRY